MGIKGIRGRSLSAGWQESYESIDLYTSSSVRPISAFEQGAYRKPPAGHVRRKFYDLQVARKSPVAAEALEHIAGLYAIEKEIRGRPRDERLEVRNTCPQTVAGIAYSKHWFEDTLGKLPREKSDTVMAVRISKRGFVPPETDKIRDRNHHKGVTVKLRRMRRNPIGSTGKSEREASNGFEK